MILAPLALNIPMTLMMSFTSTGVVAEMDRAEFVCVVFLYCQSFLESIFSFQCMPCHFN